MSLDLTTPISDFTYGPRVLSLITQNQPLGSYTVNPAGCPKGTFTYELLYYSDSGFSTSATLPSFITPAAPTTQITVATQDVTKAGDYFLKVIATEPNTGLTNAANTFKLTVAEGYFITALQFDTTIPDDSVYVGDAAKTLDQHTFSFTPSDAETTFQYSIEVVPVPSTNPAPTAGLFTLAAQANGASRLVIQTNTASDTGVYNVKFKIKDVHSSREVIDEITITVKCVKSITAGTLAATTYEIGSGSVPVNFPSYTLAGNTGITCPDELEVTSVTKSDGSTLPTQLTYTSGRSVSALETDQLNRAQSYTVKVSVRDPKTLVTNDALQFVVNI